MSSQTDQRERVVPLDGWRAISVTLVIFSHVFAHSNIAPNLSGRIGHYVIMPLIAESGYLGVDFFFVISGYVICGGLVREFNRNDKISLNAFYLRRLLRIVPPLVLYVVAVLALVKSSVLPTEAVGSIVALTFTCNLGLSNCGGWFGGHTWSLAYEEQFYIVIPLFISMLRKNALRAFVFLPGIISILMFGMLPVDQRVANFVGHFIAIAVGVTWASYEAPLHGIIKRAPTSVVLAAPVILMISVRLGDTRLWYVSMVTKPAIILFILIYTAFVNRHIASFLSNRVLAYIGRISYGMYLWQQLATAAYVGVGVIFYIISVSACVLWSGLSYRWLEMPLVVFGRSMSGRLEKSEAQHKATPPV